MKIETDKLRAVANYAKARNVSTSYLYKLIRDEKMNSIIIDGVHFIDITKYPVK